MDDVKLCARISVNDVVLLCHGLSHLSFPTRMSRASYFVTLFALALRLVLHSEHVFSEPTNVTVDDINGDPRTGNQFAYFPSLNAWHLGQNCSGCWAHVNASLAYMNTWHDVTWVSFIVLPSVLTKAQ